MQPSIGNTHPSRSFLRLAQRFLLAAAFLLPASAHGQAPEDERPVRRLALVAGTGWTKGGLSSGLEGEMRAVGYSGIVPRECGNWGAGSINLGYHCLGGGVYPQKSPGGFTTNLAIRYAIAPRFSVGAGISASSMGGANGYAPATRDYIYSSWTARGHWAAAYWHPNDAVRLGGGAGWYRLSEDDGRNFSKAGMMVEAGVAWPERSRYFFDVSARMHLVPAAGVDHGPGASRPLQVRPTHTTLGVGIGMRP